MGCGASKTYEDPVFSDICRTWDNAKRSIETQRVGQMENKLVVRRRGWKTIRIFVSSTFRDFHQERETLVKKVMLMMNRS